MFLIFKVSPKTRRILIAIVIFLNVVQVSLGIYLLVAAFSILVNISNKLHYYDRVAAEIIFSPIVFIGLAMIVVSSLGAKICVNCTSLQTCQHCGRDMIIWSCASTLLACLQITISVAAPACSSEMHRHLPSSLHTGMMNYLSDPEWKQILDGLQQGLCCCGANKYADWLHTPWIYVDFLRENSHTVLRFMRVDGRALPPVLPWSCCNPFSPTPCLHDPLQQQRSLTVWRDTPQTAFDTIFDKGCLDAVLQPMVSLLTAVPIVNGCCIALQVRGILLRYIYTSARNSILIGDPGGKAYGWIFGRGDFRLAVGSSLMEIEKERAAKQKHSGDSVQKSKKSDSRRHK